MNKAGRRVRALQGGKLPESTGDKLPAGEMDSAFLGRLLEWTFLGKFLICTGKVAPLNVRIPPGNNLILRLSGMLV